MIIHGPVRSMFKNNRDYETAVEALDSFMGDLDEADASKSVASMRKSITYACRNHLVEIAMRDKRFMMRGEETVRRRLVKDVVPPDILWFGTMSGMIESFMKNGASSKTKGYIKTHKTAEAAIDHARRYKARGHEIAVMVDSKAMARDGKRFTTYEDGVYCVRAIDASYFIRRDGKPVIKTGP